MIHLFDSRQCLIKKSLKIKKRKKLCRTFTPSPSQRKFSVLRSGSPFLAEEAGSGPGKQRRLSVILSKSRPGTTG